MMVNEVTHSSLDIVEQKVKIVFEWIQTYFYRHIGLYTANESSKLEWTSEV